MKDHLTVPKEEFIEFLKYKRAQIDQQIRVMEGNSPRSVATNSPLSPSIKGVALAATTSSTGNKKRGLAKQVILDYLKNHPNGASSSDLSNSLDLPISSVYLNLRVLKQEDKIETTDGINKLK